jgi:hypothetical protein
MDVLTLVAQMENSFDKHLYRLLSEKTTGVSHALLERNPRCNVVLTRNVPCQQERDRHLFLANGQELEVGHASVSACLSYLFFPFVALKFQVNSCSLSWRLAVQGLCL